MLSPPRAPFKSVGWGHWSRLQSDQTGWCLLSEVKPDSNSKNWLITLSGNAQSTAALRAGADLALAAGAFGQKVTLVFSGEGLALLKPEPERHESLYRLLGSLPYYEIEQVYALISDDVAQPYRNDLTVLPISQAEWAAAEMASDIVVNY